MRATLVALCLPVALALAGCEEQKQAAGQAGQPKPTFEKLVVTDKKVGEGPAVQKGDMVWVEYRGRLASNGRQFDSNINNPQNDKPFAFRAGEGAVIEGWNEGIIGMKVGGERELKIPYAKAYGASGSPPNIPPYSDLIFDIKLLHMVKKADRNVFDFEDLKVGTGREARVGDTVELHYVGRYVNGRVFDDTRAKRKTVSFRVGRGEAISGIDKGVVGMRVGGQRKLWLPPDTAWGDGGTDEIPGQQALIYEVELVSVR